MLKYLSMGHVNEIVLYLKATRLSAAHWVVTFYLKEQIVQPDLMILLLLTVKSVCSLNRLVAESAWLKPTVLASVKGLYSSSGAGTDGLTCVTDGSWRGRNRKNRIFQTRRRQKCQKVQEWNESSVCVPHAGTTAEPPLFCTATQRSPFWLQQAYNLIVAATGWFQ